MKKLMVLLTAGMFLLSLVGASLAQEKAKAPAPGAPTVEKAPGAPKAEAPAAPKVEAPAAPKEEAKEVKKEKVKKTKKTKKTRVKKKKKEKAEE